MSKGRTNRHRRYSPPDAKGRLASETESKMCRSERQEIAIERKKGHACDENGCRHREILRHTLADAIDVLESTRKAFKSKQIEALRKKLTQVLMEES